MLAGSEGGHVVDRGGTHVSADPAVIDDAPFVSLASRRQPRSTKGSHGDLFVEVGGSELVRSTNGTPDNGGVAARDPFAAQRATVAWPTT
jgi:hypothetical protein